MLIIECAFVFYSTLVPVQDACDARMTANTSSGMKMLGTGLPIMATILLMAGGLSSVMQGKLDRNDAHKALPKEIEDAVKEQAKRAREGVTRNQGRSLAEELRRMQQQGKVVATDRVEMVAVPQPEYEMAEPTAREGE